MPEFPQVSRPERLALKVVAVKTGRAVPNNDTLAVRGWGGWRGRVGLVLRHLLSVIDGLHPEVLAVLAVEAIKGADLSLFVFRSCNEHGVVLDDWSAFSMKPPCGHYLLF